MAKMWLTVRVDLLSGRGEALWPRPGRLFVVGPRHTFADLATAIDDAFARWDRAHLSMVTLSDGTTVAVPDEDDEKPVIDARRALVSRHVKPGAVFRYLFDYGDSWVHRCEAGPGKVNPLEVLGIEPDVPMPYFGWGDVPDQYGRRWDGDDGESPTPSAPAQMDPMSFFTWPDVPELPGASASAAPPPLKAAELPSVRGATYRRDGPAVVEALEGRDPSSLLQHAGDGLLVALDAGTAGAASLAEEVVRQLRERAWEGDDELADQLDARAGGVSPALRRLPVNLDQLSDLLEGDPMMASGGWLDLTTGVSWPVFQDADESEREESEMRDGQPDRWLFVTCLGSRDGYGDMVAFAHTVSADALAKRLFDALDGRGAFRRFRRVLEDAPEAEVDRWRAFSDERQRGRARAWLAGQGYAAEPPAAYGPAG
jgi:hypothetical protein